MIILGIDPGYERVGVAVLEKQATGKEVLLYSNCFKTDKNLSFHKRLLLIGEEIERVCVTHNPTLLSIETLLFNKNQKTALMVSEARGVILYAAQKFGLTVCEYTPLQIKNAVTGYGRATKDQVDTMTRQLISIPPNVKQDDEMDAIAAALTCSATQKFNTV